jgi:hypothetical protein
MGGALNRLNLFVKGNLDVRDTLHSLRIGGRVVWNGVNAVVRERHPDWSIRVQHETSSRSDAMLEAGGAIPPELAARALELGPRPLESQFSTAFFDSSADAVVLTLQPDLMTAMWRHRRDGYLFYPETWWTWPQADQAWLSAEFDPVEPLDYDAAMRALAAVVARRQARSAAPILIYNVSAAVPGELIHAHQGLEDILSTRIRRFNLGLIELSQKTGVSIIDVDTILARAGADRLKLDALHLNAEGCRLVAETVVQVLDELGLFAATETAA